MFSFYKRRVAHLFQKMYKENMLGMAYVISNNLKKEAI